MLPLGAIARFQLPRQGRVVTPVVISVMCSPEAHRSRRCWPNSRTKKCIPARGTPQLVRKCNDRLRINVEICMFFKFPDTCILYCLVQVRSASNLVLIETRNSGIGTWGYTRDSWSTKRASVRLSRDTRRLKNPQRATARQKRKRLILAHLIILLG